MKEKCNLTEFHWSIRSIADYYSNNLIFSLPTSYHNTQYSPPGSGNPALATRNQAHF
jgi:hypothetical protein